MKQRLQPRVTQKQHQALQQLVYGRTSKEIARILGVSASAIDQRFNCAARAVGVANRRALLRWYLESYDQPASEVAQVAPDTNSSASSISDWKSGHNAEVSADQVLSHAGVIVLKVPETWSTSSRIRRALESAFFVIMIVLGGGVLLEKLI